jgi:hypothetical protein
MLVTCDGNDSLKRCMRAGNTDSHIYNSSYYISSSEVDHFQNEVANSCSVTQKSKSQAVGDEKSECEKRWKNAGADTRSDNKLQKFFDETGVFLATCRHSFVLTVCDMVRSGER